MPLSKGARVASANVGLVLVSHSPDLASGVRELAAQMAPSVTIGVAAGDIDGGLGTSFDTVLDVVEEALERGRVVILTDIGSSTMTAESVLEFLDSDDAVLVDAPFVEGAIAAAVACEQGGTLDDVAGAARHAAIHWAVADSEGGANAHSASPPDAAEAPGGIHCTVTITRSDGLHARPAAVLARRLAELEATVRINGVDATSVLELMGLGLDADCVATVDIGGPDAQRALTIIEDIVNGRE